MSIESITVTASDLANLGELLPKWQPDTELVFGKGLRLDQAVVDALAGGDQYGSIRIFSCVFEGPIDFRSEPFLGENFYLGTSVFDSNVSFAGCKFPGPGSVSLDSNTFCGDVDFSGADFDQRSLSFSAKEIGGDCRFDGAQFGERASFSGDYRNLVSFKDCDLPSISIRFGPGTFTGEVDFSRWRLPATAELFIQGFNGARAFQGGVITTGVQLDGTVVVTSPEQAEILAWHTPPQVGDRIPFTAPLVVRFEHGLLAGNEYKLDSGIGVCGLLDRLRGEQKVVVSRGDVDYKINIYAHDGQVIVTPHDGAGSRQLRLSDAHDLDDLLARMVL